MIIIQKYNLGNYKIPNKCERDICVDIGANVGSFVMSQINAFKTIHYYEPFEECYNIVKEKTKDYENVIGWNEAVYNKDGDIVSMMSHYTLVAGSNGDGFSSDRIYNILK